MTAASTLCSFRDADIYPADLTLLTPPNWLNASVINFHFKRLEHKSSLLPPSAILLLDPIQVSFIHRYADDEEREEFAHAVNWQQREWILSPINNAESRQQSGEHWSLLLFHTKSGKSVHLDSSGSNFNFKAAKEVAAVLSSLSTGHAGQEAAEKSAPICPPGVPRQRDGFNCGVFVLLFAEHLVPYLQGLAHGSESVSVSQSASASVASRVFTDLSWVATMAQAVASENAPAECRQRVIADIESLVAERRILS